MPSGRLLVVDDEVEITALVEEHFTSWATTWTSPTTAPRADPGRRAAP